MAHRRCALFYFQGFPRFSRRGAAPTLQLLRHCADFHNNLAGDHTMRHVLYAGLVALLLTPAAANVRAQTAGTTTLGVTVTELKDVIDGWSVKDQLLGQSVYNDKEEKIGKIEDIILNKERTASYGIVSTGGFLGIGAHDVAIPAKQLQLKNDRLVLPGATKETLRTMPPFEYARR
jgi:sporulation protein YlmC with PRC-barrel domain